MGQDSGNSERCCQCRGGFVWKGSKESFAYAIVVPGLLFSTIYLAPLYGWQAWVLPVSHEIYNTDDLNDLGFSQGTATFISSVGIFVATLTTSLLGSVIAKHTWVFRVLFLGALLFIVAGLCITAKAAESANIWALYIGFGIINGIGTGAGLLVCNTYGILWFREIGKPGLGAGFIGLLAGIWPMVFAYATPALISWVGTSGSIYAVSIMIIALSLPTGYFFCLPSENYVRFSFESKGESCSSKENQSTDMSGSGNDSSLTNDVEIDGGEGQIAKKAQVEAKALAEMLRTPQFMQLFVGFFLFLSPGFGAKLVFGPLLISVYDADVAMQSFVSLFFFLAYGITRFVVGIATDRVPIVTMLLVLGVLQGLGIFCLSFIILYQVNIYAFLVIQLLFACGFAGAKVLIGLSVLHVFGAQNYAKMFGPVLVAYGTAGAVGPVTMWAVVSRQKEFFGGSLENSSKDASPWLFDIAVWFWVSAAVTPLAVWLLIKGLANPLPCAQEQRQGETEGGEAEEGAAGWHSSSSSMSAI